MAHSRLGGVTRIYAKLLLRPKWSSLRAIGFSDGISDAARLNSDQISPKIVTSDGIFFGLVKSNSNGHIWGNIEPIFSKIGHSGLCPGLQMSNSTGPIFYQNPFYCGEAYS